MKTNLWITKDEYLLKMGNLLFQEKHKRVSDEGFAMTAEQMSVQPKQVQQLVGFF